MHVIEAVQILAAGAAAGAINALVGSGTLVTFPVLLALGYPPIVANASNAVGLVPGSFAAAWGYRAEVATQRRLLLPLGAAALAGGIVGAWLLLVLPAATFRAVVPVLIGGALILIVVQPWLVRALRRRSPATRSASDDDAATRPAAAADPAVRPAGPALIVGVFAAGAYGGYFGAALGVLLLGLLGVLVSSNLQQVNGLKNILAGVANTVAALVFIAAGVVSWPPALLIAAGAVAGGAVAGRYGRRLPDPVLRTVIVAVGLVAVIRMVA
ncbi:sulfite exporter TauE/SafE family protein [Actinoplanes sp. NEAU-A12]|uniref:Probable membrane transporter protein n=1 Tax=Actinoplanes sandaracinus TaxID=3045177 RepID=A0ABT6WRY4_9ACTN|nr:sulfite exporter TauE/SafE family protein [Actinoplanes sandaracinus]MDI6102441.1 sulfite exporter TauE/SafE family protein [Actinoplanes sandaracinus]